MTLSLSFSTAVLAAVGFRALGRRFITWRVLPPRKPGGKPVKMPCDGRWDPIDSADERNWLPFTDAVELATRRKLGLGVALGWGLAGLDVDDCLDDAGQFLPVLERGIDVAKLLTCFPTYVEVSPSSTGVKVYFTVTRGLHAWAAL